MKHPSSPCSIQVEVFMKSKITPALPAFFCILVFILLLLNCQNTNSRRKTENLFGYLPGVYEGSGKGFRGPINVQVQVSRAGIEDIVITSHKESVYPGAAAMEELLEMILEYGSTDLDAISGATYSSKGFLNAVDDAMGQAHGQAVN